MVLELTNENFSKEVENSDIPVIVDFYADWCSPCQMMKPVFEEISKDYSGKLKFAKLNTESGTEIAQKYEISGIPCLIIIKDGKEIDRIVGFKAKNELKASINEILEKI